jgi:AcrR family transcriptional regulator
VTAEQAKRRRGRPPTLSREQILRTADTFSFEELSMPALATKLGVSQASLYYYFPGRDALVAALTEGVLRNLELGEIGTRPWRELVLEAASALRRLLIDRSSYLSRFPASISVASVPVFERILEGLERAGCTDRRAFELGELVYGWAKFSADETAWLTDKAFDAEGLRDYHRSRGIALDSLVHRGTLRHIDRAGADRIFRRNLERILDTV